jgi:hypothetical protein
MIVLVCGGHAAAVSRLPGFNTLKKKKRTDIASDGNSYERQRKGARGGECTGDGRS